MKIALISDTHNNLPGTEEVLKFIKGASISVIIHCGDLTRADMIEPFRDFCIHHVLGNGDIDAIGICLAVAECKAGSTSSSYYSDVINEKRIFALHGHEMKRYLDLRNSGRYHYIFHGHTHRFSDEIFGETRVISPGAIGGAIRGRRSFCILDLETDDLTRHILS